MDASEQIEKFQEFMDVTYSKVLPEIIRKGRKSLIVDFSELLKFDPELAELLLHEPEEVVKAAEIALEQFDFGVNLKVRFNNLPLSQMVKIRDIRSMHIDSLIFFEGIVRQSSDIRPQVVSARFECPACGNTINVLQIDSKFKEPTRCSCGRRGRFRLLSKELVDAQRLVIEEATEDLEGGSQPKRLGVFLREDLVEPVMEKKTTPGNKVRIIGVVKEIPIQIPGGGMSTRFDLVMNSNYIEPVMEEFSEVEINKEDEEEIKNLSNDSRIYERLVRSIAPSIYGHEILKEALVLQLMGGVRKVKSDGTVTRGDIHILLVGDPGAGKSALLTFISKSAPKARYVAGKGASGAGITASVVKDEFLRGWALEAGALVLANRGICVTGDTEILASGNRIYTIKDIFNRFKKGETLKVKCLDYPNLNIKGVFVKNVTKRIPDRLFLLDFDTGDKLKITEEHPLLVWDNGLYWKSVKDVKEGMFVVTPLSFPSNDDLVKVSDLVNCSLDGLPKYVDDNLMEFLGLVITDGHLSKKKHKIAFYTKDEELKERFCELVSFLFGKEAKTYVDKRSNVYHLYFYSKNVHLFLQDMGIRKGNKSKNELDLSKLYNLSNSKIKSFLVGVINGDGSVSNRKGGGCVDIICGLKKNAEQYRKLLRKIGIIGKVKETKMRGGGIVKEGNYVGSRVTITGISNFMKLYDDRIMFRKLDVLGKILRRKDNSWRVPNIGVLFDKLRSMLPHTKKALLYKNSLRVSLLRNGFGIKRRTLKKVLDALGGLENIRVSKEYHLLESIYNNEIYFTKVIKKKGIPAEEVYNLEVDHSFEPNYFANFIPVHNCVIDELDKMSVEDTSALHEGMEQQTITIAKANIQATLRSETTVLAAANPKFGRFNPYAPIGEQINLPPALINRFDLIFTMRDLPDKVRDSKIAQHVLGSSQMSFEPEINANLMKKFIAYAKQRVFPKMTDGAIEEIKKFYVGLRNAESVEGGVLKPIPVSARQLEALIRLSEGSARIRLSNKVTKKDARKAINLLKGCLMEVGMDPETGQIDIDRISTGVTAATRNKILLVRELLIGLEERTGKKAIAMEDLIDEAESKGIDESKLGEVIDKLKKEGEVFEPKRDFVQRI